MEYVLKAIYTIVVGLLSSIVIALYNKNKQLNSQKKMLKKTKEAANMKLTLGISRLYLLDRMEVALVRGYTTPSEFSVIKELYDSYRECGGNGTIQHLFEDKYEKLKIIEPKL